MFTVTKVSRLLIFIVCTAAAAIKNPEAVREKTDTYSQSKGNTFSNITSVNK